MTETGNSPTTEETSALRERLAQAHTELNELRAEAREATDTADRLRGELERSAEASAASGNEADAARAYAAAAEARLRAAAERYRDLVVRTEPELPEDLIVGDDIEAIDASVAVAKRIVGQVRSHIEQHSQPLRIPAGAPPRTAPDYSSLPPEEKIRIGLAQRAH